MDISEFALNEDEVADALGEEREDEITMGFRVARAQLDKINDGINAPKLNLTRRALDGRGFFKLRR